MGDITVNPYPREGTPHHIYANSPDRAKLGEMKLWTSEVIIDVPERASEIATALAQWCQRNPHLVAAARSASGKASRVRPPESEDYALNKPGQLVRLKAEEERARIRKKSRSVEKLAEILRVDKGQPWIKGAKGEERMARVLKRLERKGTWKVLHSIPLPKGGDIDHLLIGHDGVVVINTKRHWHKKITVGAHDVFVNGAKTDHIAQVRRQAATASTLLSEACGFDVTAIPCVAIYNGGALAPELRFSGRPKGVLIATNWNLPRVLWDAKQGLTDDQVETTYEAARQPSTWTK